MYFLSNSFCCLALTAAEKNIANNLQITYKILSIQSKLPFTYFLIQNILARKQSQLFLSHWACFKHGVYNKKKNFIT